MTSPEIFYLHIHGEQRGPYTVPQIDHLLNSGLIAEETLYWREGLDQWQPVTTLVKLRRPGRNWKKLAIVGVILLFVAVVGQFFGSVALLGWREANQHEYTPQAAYWRARGIVRSEALPPGTVIEFQKIGKTYVTMKPPAEAAVRLEAEVVESAGEGRKFTWDVEMKFDPQAREWSGDFTQEHGS
jgi:hypothetical protein